MPNLPSGLPFAVSWLGAATGEPALLLPGGPCREVEYLGSLAGVGDDRPLAVLHPRGTKTSGGSSAGWWSDAQDVVQLADALNLERVDLVAHSAGTRLALSVAAQFPDRVRSLVLVTPPATWLVGCPSGVSNVAKRLGSPEAKAALADMIESAAPVSEDGFQAQLARQAPAGYARWGALQQAHAGIGDMSLTAVRGWFQDIPVDAPQRILSVPMPPTLVIAGDRDLFTGVAPVRRYAELLGAQLETLAECGHYPWVEHPADFRRLLSQWLAP